MSVDERLSERELCPPELLRGQEEAFARDIERLRERSTDFVAVACPACASRAPEPAFEKWGFAYVTCSSCRTLYMSPRPSPEVMAAYYSSSENYRYWAETIFPASEASRREKIHRPWIERIVGYCARFGVPQGTLVEIGAGFGTFAALARDRFERVVAIEPTPELAQACRDRGVETIEQPVERVCDELVADVVVAFEVIEHLFDPRELLGQARRFLRPGGLIVTSCPN